MAMNESFRARFLQAQTEKALDGIDPVKYLEETFDLSHDIVERVRNTGKGQRRQFEELVHRENDASRWAAYIRHERSKEQSPWKRIERFPEALDSWNNSLADPNTYRDTVVYQVESAVDQRSGLSPLSGEERRQIGLRAFRRAIWRLWRGGDG